MRCQVLRGAAGDGALRAFIKLHMQRRLGISQLVFGAGWQMLDHVIQQAVLDDLLNMREGALLDGMAMQSQGRHVKSFAQQHE